MKAIERDPKLKEKLKILSHGDSLFFFSTENCSTVYAEKICENYYFIEECSRSGKIKNKELTDLDTIIFAIT